VRRARGDARHGHAHEAVDARRAAGVQQRVRPLRRLAVE
jgi:hypothetical protein